MFGIVEIYFHVCLCFFVCLFIYIYISYVTAKVFQFIFPSQIDYVVPISLGPILHKCCLGASQQHILQYLIMPTKLHM